ncbi:hypothetical protein BaRGS_00026352 [Batillaria attramentaria]|uniref:Uncharacterized protein n=1 Tax=Batillaria attramentaria TaxID=370345 RepID=A0ABD0K6I7_9CAEN
MSLPNAPTIPTPPVSPSTFTAGCSFEERNDSYCSNSTARLGRNGKRESNGSSVPSSPTPPPPPDPFIISRNHCTDEGLICGNPGSLIPHCLLPCLSADKSLEVLATEQLEPRRFVNALLPVALTEGKVLDKSDRKFTADRKRESYDGGTTSFATSSVSVHAVPEFTRVPAGSPGLPKSPELRRGGDVLSRTEQHVLRVRTPGGQINRLG